MNKEVQNYIVEKTHKLINSPSCCSEAKAAAQSWLDAIGTEREAAETKNYIAELEADIMPIDSLIGFAESAAGAKIFGAEAAKNIAIALPVLQQRKFSKRKKPCLNRHGINGLRLYSKFFL